MWASYEAVTVLMKTTPIKIIALMRKRATSTPAAVWLAALTGRLIRPPNMNTSVKSANAAGTIAVSV